jgi:hypothetical protein
MVLFFICINAHATEWAVDGKRLSNSYGNFVGFLNGVFAANDECKKIFKDSKEKEKNLGVAFSNWKQRHSYADKFRDDFDMRVKQEFGADEHSKLVLAMKNSLEGISADVRQSIKTNGEINPCLTFTQSLTEKKRDYINSRNEQFRDVSNALLKK